MENPTQNLLENLVNKDKPQKEQAIKIRDYYSPELAKLIEEEVLKGKESELQEILKTNLENFVQEVANEATSDDQAKKIGEIMRLLPGNAHDILLKYHPEYKGMQVGYVKKIIADYLGDFMLVHREWQPSDIEKTKDLLDIKEIREEILINLKNGCLNFVNLERKNNPDIKEQALVDKYFQKEEMMTLLRSGIPEVASSLSDLKRYYDEIFSLREKKPGNIVGSLKEGRVFPDINQMINIKEISEKRKMLIADEMGLGKSASAILTKEYLGLGCALVVMPSNVQDTWQKYLSDHVNEDDKQTGYFKKGLAPKVLNIDSPKDMERLKNEVFDYILISQEKINGETYKEALQDIDIDMMIVDEIHKLKNIESGTRSEAIIALSEKIKGDNKYLVLLSGTPVPNKVKDVAIILKLLYPEKYKEVNNKEMVRRILYGDLIDLRTELLKKMQMKELVTSIEMPKLTEIDIPIELSPSEREIYEILLEEDELTATEKIILFRQFLLNPELTNVQPGVTGSKIKMLEKTLKEDLQTQKKIVVFVNDYIKGVVRGDKNIIDKMDLPDDIVIKEIHGEITNRAERKQIEEDLKVGNKGMVVFVSGQTAGVGVDFSGADGVIFYNDPWSKYEKNQQKGRVYREGLKNPLTVKTLVTKNSIEEGIRHYIDAKEKAIEKLLKGISNTDAEKKLLYNDSKISTNNIETNAELSKEYLSDWEKLMVHFGEGFESGEKRFRDGLSTKGKEYAELYRKLGPLTYQGNNARTTATIIERMIDEKSENTNGLRILDVASGPEMLKDAASEKIKGSIYSMDINTEHFTHSVDEGKTIVASFLNLPVMDNSINYLNLGFAFHQTSPIKYYKKNYERLQVLAEMNRALKTGGRAVISMLYNVKFTNEHTFEKLIDKIGFKIVEDYSGKVASGENYKANFFTLEKTANIPEYKSDALKFSSADNARYITELGDKLGREFLEGLEMKKTSEGESRIRDQRRMIDTVSINEKEIKLILNEKDSKLLAQEKQSIKDGEDLKKKYGGIKNIPLDEIKAIGFERKLETPGYFLLYKIIKEGGAVIIRGDYKNKERIKAE